MSSSKTNNKTNNKTAKNRMTDVVKHLTPYGAKFAKDAGDLGNKLVGHIGQFAKKNAEKLITTGLTLVTAAASKKMGSNPANVLPLLQFYGKKKPAASSSAPAEQTTTGGRKSKKHRKSRKNVNI